VWNVERKSTLLDNQEISKLHGQMSRVNCTHQNKETILFTLEFVNVSRKCVIPVVCVKLGKWYVVKHNCVT